MPKFSLADSLTKRKGKLRMKLLQNVLAEPKGVIRLFLRDWSRKVCREVSPKTFFDCGRGRFTVRDVFHGRSYGFCLVRERFVKKHVSLFLSERLPF